MTIRTTGAATAKMLLNDELVKGHFGDGPIDGARLEKMVAEATKTQGPAAGKALRAAYEAAANRVGGPPTSLDVSDEIRAAEKWLRWKADSQGDLFIDDREAARGGNVAQALYEFSSVVSPVTPKNTATVSATAAQMDKAYLTTVKVFERAMELVKQGASFNEASQTAAKELGVPGAAGTLVAAAGGAGKHPFLKPEHVAALRERVGRALLQAREALRQADGTDVVDFDKPFDRPVSNRDRVTTDLEVSRSGFADKAWTMNELLAFAATL